jgi:hypothetical protein
LGFDKAWGQTRSLLNLAEPATRSQLSFFPMGRRSVGAAP